MLCQILASESWRVGMQQLLWNSDEWFLFRGKPRRKATVLAIYYNTYTNSSCVVWVRLLVWIVYSQQNYLQFSMTAALRHAAECALQGISPIISCIKCRHLPWIVSTFLVYYIYTDRQETNNKANKAESDGERISVPCSVRGSIRRSTGKQQEAQQHMQPNRENIQNGSLVAKSA